MSNRLLTKREQIILQEELDSNDYKDKDIKQSNILFSINPKYSRKIKKKEKRWEFRKLIWTSNKYIDKIYIYETSPTKAIIGYFISHKILKASPLALWKYCNTEAGISREEFLKYFEGKKVGYALEISELHQFKRSITPNDYLKGFHAPQNFMYISLNIEEVEDEDDSLLTEFLGCKVPKKLKEDLEEMAKENQKYLSEYIRKFLTEGLNKVKSKNNYGKPILHPPPNPPQEENNTAIIKDFLNKVENPFQNVITEMKERFKNKEKLETTLPYNYKHNQKSYYREGLELDILKEYFQPFKKCAKIIKNYKRGNSIC